MVDIFEESRFVGGKDNARFRIAYERKLIMDELKIVDNGNERSGPPCFMRLEEYHQLDGVSFPNYVIQVS